MLCLWLNFYDFKKALSEGILRYLFVTVQAGVFYTSRRASIKRPLKKRTITQVSACFSKRCAIAWRFISGQNRVPELLRLL